MVFPDYWTVDQALIWLHSRNSEMVDAAGSWVPEGQRLQWGSTYLMRMLELGLLEGRTTAMQVLSALLMRGEAKAVYNGQVEPHWFYKARLQPADAEVARKLNVPHGSMVFLRPSDTLLQDASLQFESRPIEGMAPLLEVASFMRLYQEAVIENAATAEVDALPAPVTPVANSSKAAPSVAELRRWCEAQLQAWQDAGADLADRPTERVILARAAAKWPGFVKRQVEKQWREIRPDSFKKKGPRTSPA